MRSRYSEPFIRKMCGDEKIFTFASDGHKILLLPELSIFWNIFSGAIFIGQLRSATIRLKHFIILSQVLYDFLYILFRIIDLEGVGLKIGLWS